MKLFLGLGALISLATIGSIEFVFRLRHLFKRVDVLEYIEPNLMHKEGTTVIAIYERLNNLEQKLVELKSKRSSK